MIHKRVMNQSLAFDFSAAPSELESQLHDVNAQVESFLKSLRVDAEEIGAAMLIVEEQIVNSLRHNSRDRSYRIFIAIYVRDDSLNLCIEDNFSSFNPLLHKGHAAISDLEETEIGGKSLRMPRRSAENLNYRRIDSRNVLEARIKRQKSPLALPPRSFESQWRTADAMGN